MVADILKAGRTPQLTRNLADCVIELMRFLSQTTRTPVKQPQLIQYRAANALYGISGKLLIRMTVTAQR